MASTVSLPKTNKIKKVYIVYFQVESYIDQDDLDDTVVKVSYRNFKFSEINNKKEAK